MILAKKKYMERRPKIAIMLEENTIKGSSVIAKIAGILSKAKRISVNSMIISAKNKGVAAHIPIFFTNNFCPWILFVIGIIFRVHLNTRLSFGLKSDSSPENAML